jgi:hypothetical protein
MPKSRYCPKCGRNIVQVAESSLSTVDGMGIVNESGATCFSCPDCHVILGVTANLDWLETEVSNIPITVEEMLRLSNALPKKPKKG